MVRYAAVFLLLLVGLVLVAAACGGGGDDGAGKGQRITDPARVPSSTPIQGAILFQIRGDQVSTIGGPAATVQGQATATGPRTYTVVAGDTCGSIAAKNNITLEDLLRNNRTIDPECRNLRVGDTLRIPGTAATNVGSVSGTPVRAGTPSGKTYTVAAGDTCSAIAGSYGTSVSALQAANPSMDCARLQIGQVVRIP